MTNPRSSPGDDPQDVASIKALEARLADGYARIDAAQAAGLDVASWEGFWLDLLRQYEAACDAIQDAEAA